MVINDIVHDIKDDKLVLDSNIAAEETIMDTSNCICEDTSNALLIPCNSRESPNDKPFYHQNCDNIPPEQLWVPLELALMG
uniref:Uncharacterized protein n=1 Tax=Romanomermis culicivorax TaxID=13658 RepID=A0A915HMY3_ROMCU